MYCPLGKPPNRLAAAQSRREHHLYAEPPKPPAMPCRWFFAFRGPRPACAGSSDGWRQAQDRPWPKIPPRGDAQGRPGPPVECRLPQKPIQSAHRAVNVAVAGDRNPRPPPAFRAPRWLAERKRHRGGPSRDRASAGAPTRQNAIAKIAQQSYSNGKQMAPSVRGVLRETGR